MAVSVSRKEEIGEWRFLVGEWGLDGRWSRETWDQERRIADRV